MRTVARAGLQRSLAAWTGKALLVGGIGHSGSPPLRWWSCYAGISHAVALLGSAQSRASTRRVISEGCGCR
jgi:hypothetical protein